MESANRVEMREESRKTKKWNIRKKFESIILWCKTLVRIYKLVGNWIVAVERVDVSQFEEEHWRWFVGRDGLRWRWFVGGDGCTSLPISKLSPLTHSFLPLQIQILNLFLAHNPENWDLDIVPGNPHRRNSTFDGLHRVSFSTDEDIKPHQNLLNKQIKEKF